VPRKKAVKIKQKMQLLYYMPSHCACTQTNIHSVRVTNTIKSMGIILNKTNWDDSKLKLQISKFMLQISCKIFAPILSQWLKMGVLNFLNTLG